MVGFVVTLVAGVVAIGGASAQGEPNNTDPTFPTLGVVYEYTDSGWTIESGSSDCAPDYEGWGDDQWQLTLTSAKDLTVTVDDCCCPGDFFEIYVDDCLIGTTPEPSCWGCDQSCDLSSGSFTVSLPSGTYLIKVRDAFFDGHSPEENAGMCPAGYTVSGTVSPYTDLRWPCKPVGGTIIPTDKSGLVMPWIIGGALIVVAGVSLAIWNRRRGAERP